MKTYLKARFVCSTVVLASLLPVASARAEWFYFKTSSQDSMETARIIKQPSHAQRHFGRLESKNDVDYFTFAAKEGEGIPMELWVPAADKEFRPTMTLIGPGLAKPVEDPVIPIGENNGAFIASDRRQIRDPAFHALFLTSFFSGVGADFVAPRTASYGLVIRSPDGNRGRYVLNIGSRDQWRWEELPDKANGVMRAILRLY